MKIEKTWRLPIPVDRVYAAWISNDTVVPPATAMDILPEVGGHYRLIMKNSDFTARAEGRFKVVEPEERLIYSWEWNGDGAVTEIDVRFSGSASGTDIHLIHSGFTSDEGLAMHDSGWDSFFQGFSAHCSTNRTG